MPTRENLTFYEELNRWADEGGEGLTHSGGKNMELGQ